ncbi:MAG: hypothetical protein KF726_16950 [Anaerolineae bacterium]|nr:hypothetical protein [Anaerolineae bacterium]
MNFSFKRNSAAKLRDRKPLTLPPISLLSPESLPLREVQSDVWEQDLGLSDLAYALTLSPRYGSFVRRVLAALITDPATIRWRQEVLADLLAQPLLVKSIRDLLPRLADLGIGTPMLGQKKRLLLIEAADRVSQLELYVEIAQKLYEAFNGATLRSPALLQLRDHLRTLINDEAFGGLRDELPALRQPLQALSSITIGINLDPQLQPVSCTLVAINNKPIGEESSLLERLLGRRSDDSEETGIAPLHFVPDNPEYRPLSQIFQDMDRILTQAAQPVVRGLEKYVRVSHHSLNQLEYELAFFVAAVDLIGKLRSKNVAMCQPEIAPLAERVTTMTGLVNVVLALRQDQAPVASAAIFDAQPGRIAILTGPNSGGKTTYLQAVGLAQVMAQAGLFVPANTARISPADQLLTHFPRLETRQQGRLAEEAERLRLIFAQATAHSFVLLNESLSSTAFGEALYLAQDVLAGLRSIGARTIFATHLVELVEHISEIEAAVAGDCSLYSLVAGIELGEDGTPQLTYRVTQGSPLGRSFAQEIARRHGISLEQILKGRS